VVPADTAPPPALLQEPSFGSLPLEADAVTLAREVTAAAPGLAINGVKMITLAIGKRALKKAGFPNTPANGIKNVKGEYKKFTRAALLQALDKMVGELLKIWEGPDSSGLIRALAGFLGSEEKDKRIADLDAKGGGGG
jgi:hypothetical protein